MKHIVHSLKRRNILFTLLLISTFLLISSTSTFAKTIANATDTQNTESGAKIKYTNNYIIGVDERVKLDFDSSMEPTQYLFISSNEEVVHAGKKGRITGIKKGSAAVTCCEKDGTVLYTYHVKVKKAPKKLTLNQMSFSLYPNETGLLKWTVNPKAACNKVMFLSTKPKVASISKNGKITAKAAGTTKIKVTTYNNVRTVCKVTVKPADKLLALTFDDGPSTNNTSRLLDALKANDCHATFFMVGYEVPSNRSLVKRMAKEGHELGVHSWNHQDYQKMNIMEVTNDITKACKTIYQACGQYPTLMRPPYGSYNDDTLTVMKKQGLPVVLWNTDIRDWDTSNVEKVKNDLLTKSRNGAVFVLHDSHKSTVDAVIQALPELKKKGYEIVTVSQMAAIKKKALKAGERFYGF